MNRTLTLHGTLIAAALAVAFVLPGAAHAQVDLGEPEQPAEAEPAQIPEEAKEASEVLTKYLEAVKAKKWKDARALTHPKTLAAIAERKKRLKNEDHPMAPWYYEKDQYYLKAYVVTDVKSGPNDTWIFGTSEDNFQVQEKGIAEGDPATYLVGKTGGKWLVVDKKRGVTFTKDSVRYGYKNYYDAEAAAAKKEE